MRPSTPQTIACALLFSAQVAQAAQGSTTPAAPTGVTCVLHVYGAMTPPRVKQPQTTLVLRYEGFMKDALDPSSIAYEYNPVNRAGLLADQELKSLFRPGDRIEIVRHSELMNWDQVRRQKYITPPPPTGCVAEFIISDVSAIFASERSAGLLPDLLAGGSRMTANYSFRRFDSQTKASTDVSTRLSGRLPALKNVQADFSLYRSAMRAATSEALRLFTAKMNSGGR